MPRLLLLLGCWLASSLIAQAAGPPVAASRVSFANDIMPLLARYGCNSGACHGAASGKKGFKISLLGYDPASDFQTLTRGQTGRRLDRFSPANSLLLLKPTGQAVHEGGKRFEAGSRAALLLERWVSEGATSDVATAPRPVALSVTPAFRTYEKPGGTEPLRVVATFSDGTTRDVTEDARFASNNETAALVADDGRVSLVERGEAAIMVRYAHLVAVSNLVVLRPDPSFKWNDPPAHNYIDKHVNDKLRALRILPSNLTTDEEFLRRVSYDLVGLPPTPDEVRAFLKETSPGKRERKVDELLDRPEHAELWASKWADLLKLRFDVTGDKGTWALYRHLRDHLAANRPFDALVRDLLTASGSAESNPAAGYYRAFATPEDAAEATVQVFLGVRLMCARCHDHPFEKWVQKDYYGVTAFFSQVARKGGRRQGDVVIYRNDNAPRSRHPVTGETLLPKFLDGASADLKGDVDARRPLADWLTAKDNPYFARATVNRIWGQLFGRGIIEPVDDIRSSNPPINPELLDALTKDFAKDFDLRRLVRTIVLSRTYQLSARSNRFNDFDRVNFARALPRRLSAEALQDTISVLANQRESFRARIPGQPSVSLPSSGVRAAALPDRSMTSELLDLFGRPRGESSCSCERSEEASLTHALHLLNGQRVLDRLFNPGSKITRVVTAKMSDDDVLDELSLLILARLPAAAEREKIKKYVSGSKSRTEALQDVAWALLNSRSFLFNH